MQTLKTILAVDDEPNMRRLLEISLRQAGYKPLIANNGKAALEIIKTEHIDLIVSDFHMPSMNGLALLEAIRQQSESLPFIMVTAQGEIKTAVEAMKLGASDYILRPFELETLEIAIAKALDHKRLQVENTYFREEKQPTELLIGNSSQVQEIKHLIEQVAPSKATVLITGETGTGKELVAQMLHQQSPRKNQLFVAINCAAIPADLVESELFGHEKGAFTGALKSRTGKFELANGGTLFLDEITEMPMHLQAKLLRALQEGVIEKVGDNRQISLDLRIVAATNRNPLEAVQAGKLREDLYYRLNVFQLNVSPLRERTGDISLLAKHFAQLHKADVTEVALSALKQYQWAGNVRELQNVMERAAIICKNKQIELADLPKDIIDARNLSLYSAVGSVLNNLSIPETVALIEKKLISEALLECHGNKAKAARLLEISERSLWNKLDLYQLKK
jgi:two-component system response regulator AtoC